MKCMVIALPSQYAPVLVDGKHTSMHVENSTSILKISLMHFQHHTQNERTLVKPLLILFFQMSKGASSVSNANTYYKLSFQSLNKLKEKSYYCNSENFNHLKQTADDTTLTMPPSAQVHSSRI